MLPLVRLQHAASNLCAGAASSNVLLCSHEQAERVDGCLAESKGHLGDVQAANATVLHASVRMPALHGAEQRLTDDQGQRESAADADKRLLDQNAASKSLQAAQVSCCNLLSWPEASLKSFYL